MGVNSCDRKGCENIMCQTMVDNMYICYDCQKEFQENMDDGIMEERDILDNLKGFMNRPKRSTSRVPDMVTIQDN